MKRDLLYLGAGGERWLRPGAEAARSAVVVVADFVEEAPMRATLPRLGGRDLAALVARRLQQEFRETGYRTAYRIGPGRAPKTVDWLFLGLPVAHTLDAHLRPLAESGRPIAGVWTVSLLAGAWVRAAGKPPPALLVVLPTPAGLRHVFLEHGQPVLSRLIAPASDAGAQADELERTVQYLYNARLVERGAEIPLWAWGMDGEQATALAVPGVRAGPTPAARSLPDPVRCGVEALFALALRRPPAVQLAPEPLRLHHHAARARRAIAAAGALVAAGLLATAAQQWLDARALRREGAALAAQAEAKRQELAAIDARYEAVGADAQGVRDALAAFDALIAPAPSLREGLTLASLGFQASPAYVLERLHWRFADAQPVAAATGDGDAAVCPPPPEPAATDAADAGALRAGIALEGMLAAGLSLRAAVDARRRFEAAYAGRDAVRLTTPKPPIDASGGGVIRGGGETQADERRFAYCLVWEGRP